MANDPRAMQRRDTYRWETLRPLNNLVFLAPFLVFFQIGTSIYGTNLLAPRDLDRLLTYFGATGPYLPVLTIVLVMLAQHLFHKDRWEIQPKTIAGMLGESILWMIPLIGMMHMSGRLFAQQAASAPSAEQIFQQLLSSVGAGIYEEFIFRLVFICLTLVIFVDVFGLKKEPFAAAAILVGAVTFALYHLPNAEAAAGVSSLPWRELIFRTLAGIYLGIVFIMRGFGITVATHAFYNIYVVVSQL
ncbi:unnamed protein product [marine sediment metagenome]|uniref:CAAX prenyl protease 2/Lysostaphin resistance protein A-like domain-containing protein n=1 Tax=marine sediment metagenome TaxID=412755 RepID=X0WHA3_9ZZZZ